MQFKWPEGKRDERRDVQKVSKRHGENEAFVSQSGFKSFSPSPVPKSAQLLSDLHTCQSDRFVCPFSANVPYFHIPRCQGKLVFGIGVACTFHY